MDTEKVQSESDDRNIFRKTYDWVLAWADTPYGGIALFVLAFTEASFFPIPPDVLLIALVLGARTKAFRFAMICTLGSVLGGIAGFSLGFFAWETIEPYFIPYILSRENFDLIQKWYNKNVFLVVFAAAFSPIPFKVFTIASGVTAKHLLGNVFWIFLGASIVGRGLRFSIVAYLLYRFGEPIRDWIDRYFNILTFLLILAVIAAILITRL